MDEKINLNKVVAHWNATSDKDFETMTHLYKSKDYQWCLFIGHIVIERILKACVVAETKTHAPFTHDLSRLAKLTNFDFSDEHLDWLDTITTFNLNARYDSYKQEFYKKCTPVFTLFWIKKIETLRQWIKERQLR